MPRDERTTVKKNRNDKVAVGCPVFLRCVERTQICNRDTNYPPHTLVHKTMDTLINATNQSNAKLEVFQNIRYTNTTKQLLIEIHWSAKRSILETAVNS